jgi:hypothetical protein
MDTATPRCSVRVLGALEDLVAQEGAALRARDFAAAAEIQVRVEPLVEFLAAPGRLDRQNAGLRARVASLRARRQETAEWLAAEIARTRNQLGQTQLSQRRVTQIAPVYGRAAPVSNHLSAVG